MQGGLGNDTLTDTGGNNLLDGGAGTDTLTGGAAHEMLIGGTGNDTLNTGGGADVIGFNKGDGADVVNASVGSDDTLTLGGGLAYSDLKLSKTGLDLILDASNGDQITFKNWYQTGVNNKSVLNLQVIADAMAGFNPAGADPLLNKKVVNFNFGGLVSQFDAALLANPTLTSWNLTNALTSYYLSGSDTAAIGGDFGVRLRAPQCAGQHWGDAGAGGTGRGDLRKWGADAADGSDALRRHRAFAVEDQHDRWQCGLLRGRRLVCCCTEGIERHAQLRGIDFVRPRKIFEADAPESARLNSA